MNINFIAYDIVNMAIDWCKKNDCLDHAEYIEANRRELFKKFRPICEDFILNIIYDPNMLIDTSNLRDRTPVLERFFQDDIYTLGDVEDFQAARLAEVVLE